MQNLKSLSFFFLLQNIWAIGNLFIKMDIESESCRKCFQVEIVCGISSLGLSKYHDSAQKCNILFFSFHELVEISFLIKRLYDFGNVIREIRPVILRGFGVTLSHGITKPSEKELVMRRAVGGWGGERQGRALPRPRWCFLGWKCPERGVCIGSLGK